MSAAWTAGGRWTEAADLPGRQRQFGCAGLLLLAVLVVGLVFISALYPNLPIPDNQELLESSAP